MHYVLKRSIFPQITLKCLRLNLHSLCQKSADGHDFNGYFYEFPQYLYLHQKSAHFTKSSVYLCQTSDLRPVFSTALENGHSAKMWKSILNKQVSNELVSQIVIFSQWSDIQKGYSKTRDYSEKSDFSAVADAHAHPRDTRVPLPHPHEERSVKEICQTIREKVRVMVEEVGGWVCFLQSWFECNRAKISTMAPGLWPGEDACYPIWYRCLTKTKRKDTFLRAV